LSAAMRSGPVTLRFWKRTPEPSDEKPRTSPHFSETLSGMPPATATMEMEQDGAPPGLFPLKTCETSTLAPSGEIDRKSAGSVGMMTSISNRSLSVTRSLSRIATWSPKRLLAAYASHRPSRDIDGERFLNASDRVMGQCCALPPVLLLVGMA